VGREQKGFFEFYAEEILPRLRSIPTPRGAKSARRGRARARGPGGVNTRSRPLVGQTGGLIMKTGFRRLVLTVLLASVVGVSVGGCLLVPFPVGGGGHHHRHGRW
jgi:hypothetical protein